VYRAVDAAGREVALKLLLAPQDRVRAERLLREGRLAAVLDHPHVVRLLDLGVTDDQPWLSWELVAGARPLDVAMRGLDLEEKVRLLCQAAAGVAHAHARGVTHRDLKPANVLVDASGRARVADFGMAIAEDEARLTISGALTGSPLWMAPEQVRGRREEHGPRTDVWALGVMLYQALTGSPPFQGDDLPALCVQILEARPVPPRQLARGIPPALERECLRARQLDPAARHADAGELQRALESALAAPPERTTRVGAGRLAWGVALTLALAVGSGAALVLGGPGGADAAPVDPLAEIQALQDRRDHAAAVRLASARLAVAPEDARAWCA
jgi:serine/threonine-protein kinase